MNCHYCLMSHNRHDAFIRVHVCVSARVRVVLWCGVCVYACVRACVRACVYLLVCVSVCMREWA